MESAQFGDYNKQHNTIVRQEHTCTVCIANNTTLRVVGPFYYMRYTSIAYKDKNKATRKKLSVPGFLGSPAGGRSVGFFFLLINSLHASGPRTCTEVHDCTVQCHVHVQYNVMSMYMLYA